MKNLLIILLLSAGLFAGCNKEDNDGDNMKNHDTTVTERKEGNASIIRTADVNVAQIDKNNDAKVFQCPMDFDVISDQQESCPKCKMDLDLVSVETAQKNLK